MPIPAISVIVPMRNCEKYIAKCLNSLKDQSFGGFEVICVDDASTDSTAERARSAVGMDKRFTFFQQPASMGLAAARNMAMDHASGDYIMFLNPSDRLAPEALGHLIARSKTQRLDHLYFSGKKIVHDKKGYEKPGNDIVENFECLGVMTGQKFFVYCMKHGKFLDDVCLHLFSRDLLRRSKLRFNDEMMWKGSLFTYLALFQSKRSSFMNERLYVRVARENSATQSSEDSIQQVNSRFACTQEMRKLMTRNARQLDPEFRKYFALRITQMEAEAGRIWVGELEDQTRDGYIGSLSQRDKLEFFSGIAALGATNQIPDARKGRN